MRPFTFLLVAVLLMFTLCVCAPAQITQSQIGGGKEWLSWSPQQRTGYVDGYIDGYLGGTLGACRVTDDLFEREKKHTLGVGSRKSDLPSSRCLARRGGFSEIFSDRKCDEDGHLDVSIYTDAITAFYEKHSNCLDHPFSFLLEAQRANYLTGDQLYDAILKVKLKTRSRVWCGFQ